MVISIIALLISILLPALGAARESARAVACLSNQRQLGIGFAAYAQDFDRTWPVPAQFTPNQFWHQHQLASYIAERDLTTGPDWESYAPGSIFECPSADDTTNAVDHPNFRGYGMNANLHFNDLSQGVTWPSSGQQGYKFPDRITAPSDAMLLIGTNAIYSNLQWLGAAPGETGKRVAEASTRHDGSNSTLFADGHAERLAHASIPAETTNYGDARNFRNTAAFWFGKTSGF